MLGYNKSQAKILFKHITLTSEGYQMSKQTLPLHCVYLRVNSCVNHYKLTQSMTLQR